MALSPNNVKVGPALIAWGTSLIGFTTGGTEISVATQTTPCTVDQFGTAKANEFITGRNLIVKLKMAEATLDNFFLTLSNAGATQPNGPNTGVYVKTGYGIDLMPDAAPMLLRPINALDGSEDFWIPAASYTGDIEFSYQANQIRSFALTFATYPDPQGILFHYGITEIAQNQGAVFGQTEDDMLMLMDRFFVQVEDRQSNSLSPD